MFLRRVWIVLGLALIAAAAFPATQALADSHRSRGVTTERHDVTAFYQERIANEGFVATAKRTGRRTVSIRIDGLRAQLNAYEPGTSTAAWDDLMKQRLRVDLRAFDEADALFGKVRVSGKSEARMQSGAFWRAEVNGAIECVDSGYQDGDDLLLCGLMKLDLEISGPLFGMDGACKAGEMTLRTSGVFDAAAGSWKFIGDDVGAQAIGSADLRVMPGDNVNLGPKRSCFVYQKVTW